MKVELENKDCILVEFEGEDVPYFAYGRAYMRFAVVYRKDIEELVENTEKNLAPNDPNDPNDPINDPINKIAKIEIQILKEIAQNPYVTRIDLSQKLQLSDATIKRNISNLKSKKIIERVGANKNGYWKIINKA